MTQFRAEMPPGLSFYNAGRAAPGAPTAAMFLDRLYTRHRPEMVVVGIDPWWFHPSSAEAPPGNLDLSVSVSIANLVRYGFSSGFLAALKAAPAPDPLGGRHPVGALARTEAAGFRPDGSYQYGDVLQDLRPEYHRLGFFHSRDFRYFRDQLSSAGGRFPVAPAPSATALNRLDSMIAQAHREGVGMILLFPPLPHALVEAIAADPRQSAWFAAITAATADLARRHDVAFVDLTDLALLGIDDSATIDGIHADEPANALVLARLIRQVPGLAAITGIAAADRLEQLVAEPGTGPHRLFR